MATISGSLNIFVLITSVFFLIFSIASYPQKTTKCLLCLISISKLLDSFITLSSLAFRWLPNSISYEHFRIWSMFSPYLNPLVEFQTFIYTFYSIHRYAVIVEKDSFFQKIQSIKGLIGYSVIALSIIYAHNIGSNCVCFDDCGIRCKIFPITDVAIEMTSLITLICLQFYIVKSTSKIMAVTEKFLKTLSMTEMIARRLVVIKRIKKFNIRLTVLMILSPVSRLTRKLVFGGIAYFCANCYTDTETVFQVEFFTFDLLEVFNRPVSFLFFVFLHLNKMKETCLTGSLFWQKHCPISSILIEFRRTLITFFKTWGKRTNPFDGQNCLTSGRICKFAVSIVPSSIKSNFKTPPTI